MLTKWSHSVYTYYKHNIYTNDDIGSRLTNKTFSHASVPQFTERVLVWGHKRTYISQIVKQINVLKLICNTDIYHLWAEMVIPFVTIER